MITWAGNTAKPHELILAVNKLTCKENWMLTFEQVNIWAKDIQPCLSFLLKGSEI